MKTGVDDANMDSMTTSPTCLAALRRAVSDAIEANDAALNRGLDRLPQGEPLFDQLLNRQYMLVRWEILLHGGSVLL